MDSSLLFVYGSLRRQFEGHVLLERISAVYLGRATVTGQLFDLGRFPGAVKPRAESIAAAGEAAYSFPDPGEIRRPRELSRIVGEVFRLRNPERALKLLDKYEGLRPTASTRNPYARELVEATLENGERVISWIYWISHLPRSARRIISGDYAKSRCK